MLSSKQMLLSALRRNAREVQMNLIDVLFEIVTNDPLPCDLIEPLRNGVSQLRGAIADLDYVADQIEKRETEDVL